MWGWSKKSRHTISEEVWHVHGKGLDVVKFEGNEFLALKRMAIGESPLDDRVVIPILDRLWPVRPDEWGALYRIRNRGDNEIPHHWFTITFLPSGSSPHIIWEIYTTDDDQGYLLDTIYFPKDPAFLPFPLRTVVEKRILKNADLTVRTTAYLELLQARGVPLTHKWLNF